MAPSPKLTAAEWRAIAAVLPRPGGVGRAPRTIGAERRIDGTTKTLRFPDLGVTLNLTKEQVYMLEVYDPKSNH